MKNPLVSVLIPTYNQDTYVEEAVTSALKQDYDDLQVVVVDDASTDGTRFILERLATLFPERMCLILGDENLGITGNCNRGLAECKGSLVALQGGDDVLLPGKISKQVKWFQGHSDGALCYHDCEVFESETGQVICNFSELSRFADGHGPARIIRNMRFSAAVSVMVRADLIPDSGFDVRLPVVSDWKLQIDVLSKGGRYGYIAEVLARYRRHNANSKKAFPTQYYQDCLVTLAIVETEMPGFSRQARIARARIFGMMSIGHLMLSSRTLGTRLAISSVRQGIFSWKFPFVVLFLFLPKSFRDLIRRLLSRKVRALNYLGA